MGRGSTFKYLTAEVRREASRRENFRKKNHRWDDFPEGAVVDRQRLGEIFIRSPKSIANWVRTQDLPTVRVNYVLHFDLREVLDWAREKPLISDRQFYRLQNYMIERGVLKC